MLIAHPMVLRNLVDRYEALQLLPSERRTPQTEQEREDVSYTLCVTTGTRTVEDALVAAEQQLRASSADPAATAPDVRLTA
ncbi:DUF5133 domain-containing protein [Streptomyces sp. NPDC059398]|uniref:DUF5133 domain-containing protein n=1 Tax=Streptomyces sp. NPDC059398 TaxID=3346820 RepID=UPI0036845F93